MPRRRQVVVRFSDAEIDVVRERAALAGMAVGAWIGHLALAGAHGAERQGVVGLPELLRLHADVVLVGRAVGGDDHGEQVAGLLARLDAAIDVVVSATWPRS